MRWYKTVGRMIPLPTEIVRVFMECIREGARVIMKFVREGVRTIMRFICEGGEFNLYLSIRAL